MLFDFNKHSLKNTPQIHHFPHFQKTNKPLKTPYTHYSQGLIYLFSYQQYYRLHMARVDNIDVLSRFENLTFSGKYQ